MSVPKQKHTRGRKNRRRSHHGYEATTVTVCKQCKQPVRPHRACPACGYYQDKQIVKVKTVLDKKKPAVKET